MGKPNQSMSMIWQNEYDTEGLKIPRRKEVGLSCVTLDVVVTCLFECPN